MQPTRAGRPPVANARVARHQTVFLCGSCGRRELKWLGRCPDCGAWDSFVEEAPPSAAAVRRGAAAPGKALRLSEVASSAVARFTSGISELDLVLGGGIVPGSLVLVGGEPGIGKSTLLLQALDAVAAGGRRALLVCGEESASQVKMRADRICRDPGGVLVFAETELETVVATVMAESPDLIVVDSVQTLYSDAHTSAPGSVSQVREVATRFLRLAKETDAAVFLVGHVTKDGSIAGPRVLEHMVDTVLQFEGDRYRAYRTLRAVKNRFGSTDELGIFEMRSSGLNPVADASRLFLGTGAPAIGSCVHIAVEGSRCFPVEIQALVSPSEQAVPRRVAVGFDRTRLMMLIAVLDRHAGIPLSGVDVFVTIAGGIRIDEPAADFAVVLALASAERGRILSPQAAAIGEIALTGELRSCSQTERRVAEAERAGLMHVIVPAGDPSLANNTLIRVADVRTAVSSLLPEVAVRTPADTAGRPTQGV